MIARAVFDFGVVPGIRVQQWPASMAKFRTHYDNLKVSRDAPIEVIQAAYRSLARKYHPDKTGSTAEGDTTMKILNASYEVLSDPVKRAQHDRWIAGQLNEPALPTYSRPRPDSAASASGRSNPRDSDRGQRAFTTAMLTFAFFAASFWMIRTPGLRLIGIFLLLAGWAFVQARPK
jgi:DnaJ-class molecular chaperone